ncbi:hypothetical protein ACF06X_09970 [Streptomyces sp. NPDC015346]|uniref:hypothetical protein n=1 Tax=Streptomyces sp. NPDC015346 TaxID=3364954 RepID=UPI0036F6A581
MIRHTVRALCAASLIVAPLALSTPAHAVTCTVNGFSRTATHLTGTAGNDYIRCASIPAGHSVDGLGGNDYISVTGTVAQGAEVRGGTGNDYMQVSTNNGLVAGNEGDDYIQVNTNNGVVSGGAGTDSCQVASGNAPQADCEVG